MKFSEDRLYRLHKIVKNINALDLGAYCLPESFGIFDKDGNLEAVIEWNGSKYDISLISEAQKQSVENLKEEIRSIEEVKEEK